VLKGFKGFTTTFDDSAVHNSDSDLGKDSMCKVLDAAGFERRRLFPPLPGPLFRLQFDSCALIERLRGPKKLMQQTC
jgi:hypothetical protein